VTEAERIADAALGDVVPASPTVSYRRQLAECRNRLRDVVSSGGPQLEAMVEEGKLLRATLVLASGSPLGASDSALLPAAVSIELLHLASLVHDDIIDEATERRGRPALHVAAGRDRALVVGDFLIVAAFDVIGELRGSAPDGAFAASVDALSKGAQLCCFGQLEELDPRDRVPTEDHYLDVAARKTGSLFAAAAKLGALAAGADPEGLATLAALGTQLGVAYQIRDDLCDRAGNERWQRRTASSPGHAGGVSGFSPTSATYARAVRSVFGELDRLPASSSGELRGLVEAMVGSSAVADGHEQNG
jgi:geranylgeranyl pyrophosphate synthase